MAGGAGLAALASTIRATIRNAAAVGGEAAELGSALDAALGRLTDVTGTIHGPDVDPATRLANASLYLEAAGHIVIAWIWLEQFLATGHGDEAFLQGKRQAARYFYRYELPRTGPQLELLAQLDRVTVDTDPEWF